MKRMPLWHRKWVWGAPPACWSWWWWWMMSWIRRFMHEAMMGIECPQLIWSHGMFVSSSERCYMFHVIFNFYLYFLEFSQNSIRIYHHLSDGWHSHHMSSWNEWQNPIIKKTFFNFFFYFLKDEIYLLVFCFVHRCLCPLYPTWSTWLRAFGIDEGCDIDYEVGDGKGGELPKD